MINTCDELSISGSYSNARRLSDARVNARLPCIRRWLRSLSTLYEFVAPHRPKSKFVRVLDLHQALEAMNLFD